MISVLSAKSTYRLLKHLDVVRLLSKASKSKGLSLDQLKTSIPTPRHGPKIGHVAPKNTSQVDNVTTKDEVATKQTPAPLTSTVAESCSVSDATTIEPKFKAEHEMSSTMSKEEVVRLEARKQRSNNIKSKSATHDSGASGKSSNTNMYIFLGFSACVSMMAYASYEIKYNKNGAFGKLYYGTTVEQLINFIDSQTFGRFREVFYPTSDKLLPDFVAGPFYGPLPPDAVAPPLLILDLEKTVIVSTYDVKHGWRHAKRPGLDKLIEQMKGYYEVALFSENEKGE